MRRLEGIQKRLQLHDNTGGMRRLEINLQKRFSRILNQEELMWHQRSRALLLADGVRNTKYYHMQTIARRKRIKILMLKDENGDWINEHKALKKHVTKFYKNLFAGPNHWCKWEKTKVSFPLLDEKCLRRLEGDIHIDEVKCTLFSMKPWKVLGPNGFPAGFYQKDWKVVGVGLSKLVQDAW
ncbi:uncharacterized protein LOC131650759 [Vicia villosa]|uniref:uncharacterized protein LOC131650759 n=1 Tax=Vicia villosa TaxID=3911 RepID=UPI00273CEF61|nr:uncharacterized protein LOC131650759 [Vicia villosa]